MTDDEINELVLAFLDTRGGYVAGASERELFLMVKGACALERERCAAACDAVATDLYAQYTGRAPHAPNNPARADPHMEGQSDGADACAAAIRALS